MSTLIFKINRFLMKYIWFMLYPTSKLGKEEKNQIIHKNYEE